MFRKDGQLRIPVYASNNWGHEFVIHTCKPNCGWDEIFETKIFHLNSGSHETKVVLEELEIMMKYLDHEDEYVLCEVFL